MPRIVDLGVTRYDWIPGVAGLTTPLAPKVTELIAAGVKNISTFVITSTKIAVGTSDKVSEKGITDVANVDIPTIGNYSGTLSLFRDFTAGVPTASVDLLATFAASNTVGWIVRRIGLPFSTAYAIGQKVDVFLFATDNPDQSGGDTGFLKMSVPLLQQGQFYQAVTTVA